jgi:hypothetical protein
MPFWDREFINKNMMITLQIREGAHHTFMRHSHACFSHLTTTINAAMMTKRRDCSVGSKKAKDHFSFIDFHQFPEANGFFLKECF